MFAAAVASDAATGRDHAVGRHARPAAAHDVADSARGAGASGQFRHLPVRDHATRGDPADDREDTGSKRVRSLVAPLSHFTTRQRSASLSGRPSAFGSAVPVMAARVGATSPGEAGPS